MSRESRREQSQICRSLISLSKALEKQVVTIDLRNESCLTGRLTSIDSVMNIELENVMFYDPVGANYFFENFFVQTRNIRYVHIPTNKDPEILIKSYLENPHGKLVHTGKRPRTFRESKAQKYQQSLLQDLSKPSTSSENKD